MARPAASGARCVPLGHGCRESSGKADHTMALMAEGGPATSFLDGSMARITDGPFDYKLYRNCMESVETTFAINEIEIKQHSGLLQ